MSLDLTPLINTMKDLFITMNWLDYLIVATVTLSISISLCRGFLHEMISLFTWFIAIYVTIILAQPFSLYLKQWLPANLSMGFSIVILFLAALGIGILINKLANKLIDKSKISCLNKLLGGLFGLLRGLLIVIAGLIVLQLAQYQNSNTWKKSVIIPEFTWMNHTVLSKAPWIEKKVIQPVKKKLIQDQADLKKIEKKTPTTKPGKVSGTTKSQLTTKNQALTESPDKALKAQTPTKTNSDNNQSVDDGKSWWHSLFGSDETEDTATKGAADNKNTPHQMPTADTTTQKINTTKPLQDSNTTQPSQNKPAQTTNPNAATTLPGQKPSIQTTTPNVGTKQPSQNKPAQTTTPNAATTLPGKKPSTQTTTPNVGTKQPSQNTPAQTTNPSTAAKPKTDQKSNPTATTTEDQAQPSNEDQSWWKRFWNKNEDTTSNP